MPDQSSNTISRPGCSICSQLADRESATQKQGWEQNDTRLPSAANHLNLIRDLKPSSYRKLQLHQCPECGTYYLYRTDYEYLAGGSEDDQHLTRLSASDAAEYLQE